MERLMQYMDDLEDVIYALALAAGRIARAAGALIRLAAAIATPIGIFLLALVQLPLGLAAATLLSVILLYRAVVNRPARLRHANLPQQGT
ncbi:MAG TPA: hypothetical protein VE175_00310 [Woeseiaceae bacterium]|jgi:membrane protein implicated in regulation of membrane protease activity|nr:hypothetical protein [Woeseiaceae bacterium]